MKVNRGWRLGMLAIWVSGAGCTALREIPRRDYVAHVGERPVRVVTSRGDDFDLESTRIEADSLIGYRRLDVEGPIEEFETVRLALDDVASISVRRVDWYRTGIVGVTAAAAIVATATRSTAATPAPTGGGKTPLPE
jgi:hypothetical protein